MALLRATHLVDKSALARMTHPGVEARLRPRLEEGFVATCAIIDLMTLLGHRSPEMTIRYARLTSPTLKAATTRRPARLPDASPLLR